MARLALVVTVAALVSPGAAPASKQMLVGIFDDASTYGAPATTFPQLERLHVQVLRMTLTWGGHFGVANDRPAHPNDPADPAYHWGRYDDAVEQATRAGIQVLFTIVGTPDWANGGQGPRVAPRSGLPLRQFAAAAALRYSGTYLDTASGRILPRVSLWLAWNEPNNAVFLRPQFARVGGRWQFAGAAAYARICNAIYAGVHSVGGPSASRVARPHPVASTTRLLRGSRPRRSRSSGRRRAPACVRSMPGPTIRTTRSRVRRRRRGSAIRTASASGTSTG